MEHLKIFDNEYVVLIYFIHKYILNYNNDCNDCNNNTTNCTDDNNNDTKSLTINQQITKNDSLNNNLKVNNVKKVVFFPHTYLKVQKIDEKNAIKEGYQKIKFNYLYKNNDGTHTNKGLMYDKLPTINSYYNIITGNTPSTTTTTTTVTKLDIDLTLATDIKNNVLRNYLPAVYNQGGYGTCTANATAMVYNILKLVGGNP